jgi:hypothetical protein
MPSRSVYRFTLVTSILYVISFFGIVPVVTAQERAPRLAVLLADTAEDGVPGSIREMIHNALAARAEHAGFEVVSQSAVEQAAGTRGVSLAGTQPDRGAAFTVGRDLGADVLALGFYTLEDNEVRYQILLYDLHEGIPLDGAVNRVRSGLTMYSGIERSIERLEPVLVRYREDPYRYTRPPDEVESIVFTSRDEDAEVYFAGRHVGMIKNGRLQAPFTPFTVGTDVTLEVQKPGYHVERRNVTLPSVNSEIRLRPLRPRYRYGVYGVWTLGQAAGAGLGVRFYPVPDYTFIAIERHFYIQDQYTPGSAPVYHNDMGFAVGQYLFLGYRSVVRFSVSAGAGVMFTAFSRDDIPDYVDFYFMPFSPALELNLGKVMVFLRQEFRYATGAGENSLLQRDFIFVDGSYPLTGAGVVLKW